MSDQVFNPMQNQMPDYGVSQSFGVRKSFDMNSLPTIGAGSLAFIMFIVVISLFIKYKKKANNATLITFFVFLVTSLLILTVNVHSLKDNKVMIAMNVLAMLLLFSIMIMILVL